MDLAAANGHQEIVQYLYMSRCTDIAIYSALENKHYGVMLYLYRNCVGCTTWPKEEDRLSTILAILATLEVTDILIFLRVYRAFRLERQVMNEASSDCNLDLVRKIHDLDLGDRSPAAMNRAAEAGHLRVVRFLDGNRSEGCSCYVIEWAARNGH